MQGMHLCLKYGSYIRRAWYDDVVAIVNVALPRRAIRVKSEEGSTG